MLPKAQAAPTSTRTHCRSIEYRDNRTRNSLHSCMLPLIDSGIDSPLWISFSSRNVLIQFAFPRPSIRLDICRAIHRSFDEWLMKTRYGDPDRERFAGI